MIALGDIEEYQQQIQDLNKANEENTKQIESLKSVVDKLTKDLEQSRNLNKELLNQTTNQNDNIQTEFVKQPFHYDLNSDEGIDLFVSDLVRKYCR